MSAPSSAHALGSRYIRFRFNHIKLTGFFDRPKFILADTSKPSRRKWSAISPSTARAGGQWIRIVLNRQFRQGEKGELLVFGKV